MLYPLVVSNLKKSYYFKGNAVPAVKGISFKVKKGEILGLLGPNGAGKTTTINILTGLLSADAGKIKFFGKTPCEDTQNRINAATAYNSLNGIITVKQNLRVYAKIYNVKNSEEKINNLLKKFGIFDLRDQRVYNLSSGQKTRVNVCKSLINSPELVFLDEATAGLDPDIADHVRKEIKRLNTTVIFTSHIMSEVEKLCDRIIFLDKGRILKVDSPQGIKNLVKSDEIVLDFFAVPKNYDEVLKQFKIIFKNKNKAILKYSNKREVHTIIHTLITAGFEIRDFHIKRPTLDEVFVKVARGEI